jgi:hypothetical protein
VKEWMPNNPVLRFLTPPLRDLLTYPVKMDSEYIYINVQGIKSGNSAEIVFGGATQAGKTASDVSVDEVLPKDLGFCHFFSFLKICALIRIACSFAAPPTEWNYLLCKKLVQNPILLYYPNHFPCRWNGMHL